MDPVERRNQWRNTIEKWLASGMPINRWCALNKVAPSTFYSWMAKFRKEEAELFGERTASEWIEITKEGIAASVALTPVKQKPVSKLRTSSANADSCSQNDTPNHSTPLICTRINGVEMSISAGVAQTDIEAVFKAAMSL